MKRNRLIPLTLPTFFVLLVLAIMTQPLQAGSPAPDAHNANDAVQAAWQRATELGVYDFATEILQTTHPAPLVSNAGEISDQAQVYMEGQANVPARELTLSLWQDGGSALDAQDGVPSDGVEIRFQGDQAYGRPIGGEWQKMDNFSSTFAPGQDLLAYLAGIQNVRLIGEETRALPMTGDESRFTHYAFEIDGPAFARYLRDQLETQLRESGELPMHMTLDTPRQYVKTTGEGEIWLDERGLPARLRVHLVYPPGQTGERVESEIQTDFSNFPEAETSAAPVGRHILREAQATARTEAPTALMFAISLGFIAFLVSSYRSKKVYAAFVVAVLASMIVTPLLQSHQVYAFTQKMNPKPTTRNLKPTTSNLQPATRNLKPPTNVFQAESAPPLDTDTDGLSDEQENFIGTDPTSADTDGDGIQDGSEALYLGTDPLSDDSDSDQVHDRVEANGFAYAGEHWYLDPNNPDTNGDGRIDALECPELMSISNPSALVGTVCDPDGDGTPNPFDFDDDDDGVPDDVDLSPEMSLDRDGVHTNGQHLAPFDAEQPFALQVDGLGTGGEWPVLVDLQIRPDDAEHLAYALNVLDWPADAEGQVQHVKNTTFPGEPGDVRLVPMLEIEITGDSVPFKLTAPAIDVAVSDPWSNSAISATLHLTQQADQIRVAYAFDDGQSYTAAFYAGACGDIAGPPLAIHTATDGAVRDLATGQLTDLADGAHAVVVSGGGTPGESVCATIGNIVNGPYENRMIDPAPLEPYGISVREADRNGTLLAYAPANLVKGVDGGGKAAFASRLLYWPGEGRAWEQPQAVRLVWVVEVLSDWCDAANFTGDRDQFDAWCRESANRTTDQVQIVQTYDDTWYLTGLTVREDLGLDVAVAYEDPATDADPYQEDALWHVARGLGDVFVTGRDADGNDQRDIAITSAHGDTTIRDRFDRFNNGGTSAEQRWGIARNALRVETFQYAHQDHVMQIAMHETPRILAQFPSDASPTLLFAREEHYRIAGMASAAWDGEAGRLNLTAATEEVTTAALQWSPFRYDGAGGWERYPIAEYWDHLDVTLTGYFQEQYPGDSAEVNAGRMAVARAFYASLVQGIVRNVEGDQEILWTPDPAERDTDAYLTTALMQQGNGLHALVVFMGHLIYETIDRAAIVSNKNLMNLILSAPIDDGIDILFETLGAGLANFVKTPITTLLASLGKARTAAIGSGAGAGALIAVGLTVYAATQAGGAVQAVTIVMLGLSTLSAIWGVVQTTAEVVKAVKDAGSVANALSNAVKQGIKGSFSKGGLVGAVIGVVIAWAVFAMTLAFSDLSRAAIGYALGALIASIIVTDIMFAIGLIPIVGAIIVAVVNAIDTVVALLCGVFLSGEQQQGTAAKFLCGGLTGLATALLEAVLYSNTVMVDMQPEDFDRLQFGDFEAHELVDPDRGFVVGNRLLVSVTLTNTIRLADRPASVGAAYAGQWDQDTLKSSTFRYRWQSAHFSLHGDLSRGEMADAWRPVGDPADAVQYADTQRSESGIPLSRAGINYATPLYLSEGYAIPVQECVAGVCYVIDEKDTFHYNFSPALRVDVFPPTLDEFYALTPIGGGAGAYRLAWDPRFPTLQDADGDGLSRAADPDDARWDTDADGLSDLYERQHGGDPTTIDTDGDGLDDDEEARRGTALNRPDTDGDGLSDRDEVMGWELIYGLAPDGTGLRAWITSDPLDPDADGDGLTDFQEKTYGLNPYVVSNPTVLSMASAVQEGSAGDYTPSNGFVRPGETFHYEATLKNELLNRYAQGLLETDFPQAMETGDVPPASFILYPQEAQVVAGDVRVSPVAASGPYSLTQVAGASIVDWRAISGGAQLWLPFEDEATSATKTYQDRSGTLPPHDGTCVGDSCFLDQQDGRYGGSLRLNGGYVSTGLDPSEADYAASLWFKTGQADGGLVSVEHRYGARLYLQAGQVCASYFRRSKQGGKSVTEDVICASDTYHDEQWHHVVHTFGAGGGGQRLYVDGVNVAKQAGGNAIANAGHIAFGHGRDGVPDFVGKLDDVRIYDVSLDEAKVSALFSQPVLDLSFDEDAGWPDHSGFDNDAACPSPPVGGTEGGNCPDHVDGLAGGAARFAGAQCLDVGPDASLDLSQGHFSIATWVYPQSGSGEAQTILGAPTPGDKSYPTLQRVGRRVRFGFGTGDTWAGPYESGAVLAENAWNHVVLTFETGVVRLYVNGALVGTDTTTFAGLLPTGTVQQTFGVGCSTDETGDRSAYFSGKLDEIRVYRQTLDAEAVQDLYDATTVMLRMPFDEAPGANTFSDVSGQHVGACSSPFGGGTGGGCPTSGVAGRINRAARFWGDPYNPDSEDDRIRFPNSEINRLTNDFTLTAWIKPATLRDYYEYAILSTGDCNGGGFRFYLDGAELRLKTERVKDYVSGFDLTTGRWTHVAVVLDETNDATFYVNGEQVGQMSHTAPADADDVAPLLIGASMCGGRTTAHFDGAIDDLTILRRSLSEGQVRRLYRDAPVLQLHLDEAQPAGETGNQFMDESDNGNHATCAGGECPQGGFAIQGKIGRAIQFDGVDHALDDQDVVVVSDASTLDLDTFSVAAWVRPTARGGEQTLVEKATFNATRFDFYTNYGLYLTGDLNPAIEFTQGGDSYSWQTVPAIGSTPLVMNHWNHVVGTYDGATLRLYVNGYEQAATASPYPSWPPDVNDAPVEIGNGHGSHDEFAGRIDELAIYDRALTASEVHDAFLIQGNWVEDEQRQDITVDADAPTSNLYPPATYWPNLSGQLLAFASDPTSGIARAEVGVNAPGQTGFTWTDMPQCLDTSETGGESWCPTFKPSGAGTYELTTRVTDLAGNTARSATTRRVYVDDAPPTLSFSTSRISIFRHPSIQHAWLARIRGEVSDPALPGGAAGSGVPESGVRVSLYDTTDGALVGEGDVTAVVSGTTWHADYVLPVAQPANEYLVRAEAVDHVARIPGLDEGQVARHTTVAEATVAVDALGPVVQLDRSPLPDDVHHPMANPLLGNVTLSGTASERPVPIQVTWSTAWGAYAQDLAISCGGWEIHTVPAETLLEHTSYTWRGRTYQGASCHVSGPVDRTEGRIEVCGRTVVSWTLGSGVVPFTADTAACPPDRAVAGVDQVELGWQAILPDSDLYGEASLVEEDAGPLLVLPFDEDWIAGGGTVEGISEWAHTATLHSGESDTHNKIVPGQVGAHALALDGVDDYVRLTPHEALDMSDLAAGFTQAAWIYPSASPGLQPVLGGSAYSEPDRAYPFIHVLDGTRLEAGFGADTFGTDDVLTPNAWHHVATTFDGATYRIYADGQEVAATTILSGTSPYPAQTLDIGSGTKLSSMCVTLDKVNLHVVKGLAERYRVQVNGEVIFTTPYWPDPSEHIDVDFSQDYCSGVALAVEMLKDGAWQSMHELRTSSGLGRHLAFFVDPWPPTTTNWPNHSIELRYTVSNLRQGMHYFDGRIDDVRIYTRALSAFEIDLLSRTAWQAITPSPAGAGVVQGDWSAGLPDGLEGVYQLDLRGRDVDGHVDQVDQNVWRGSVDTQGPRVSATRAPAGYRTSRYTVVAEDYHLAESGFRSPCGGSAVAEREYVQTPWYTRLSDVPRLYRLRAECEIPEPGHNSYYDTPGMANGVALFSDGPISGTQAYVADGSAGVHVLDVSDPIQPTLIGSYTTLDGMRALDIAVASSPLTTTLQRPRITLLKPETQNPKPATPTPLALTAAITYHVTTTGTGTCTTWADACDLQTALAAAVWGDEVWIAGGTYYPGITRTLAFTLNSGVALYGGFATTETRRSQRDWNANPTVLSGDIGLSGVITDNTYHVISITTGVTEATVLDGFTITGGNADGFSPDGYGGGIYNAGGSPTLRHLVIQGNYATNGGGMYSASGRPILKDVGVISNTTTGNGGGLMDDGGGFVLRDVTLLGNTTGGYGGGLYNNGDSDLVNVVFERNTTDYSYGGGMSNGGNSRLVNVAFYGNVAGEFGSDGGGLYNYGDATLVNVVFSGNETASGAGGGMFNDTCQPTLVNATFSGNQAASGGSAIHNNQSNATVQNNILWGNGGTAIANASSTVTVTYSLVEGGWTGAGNLDANPRFTRAPSAGTDAAWGTADDDYGNLSLLPDSPALDAGDNVALPTDSFDLDGDGVVTETLPLDLAGTDRRANVATPDTGNGTPPLVDMGAYELIAMDLALTKSVTPTGPNLGDPITYTLVFSNPGSLTPTANCVITDAFPAAQVISTTVVSSGVSLTPIAPYVWEMASPAPGQGGVITITGVVSPGLTQDATFTNTAVIGVVTGTLGDVDLTNNSDAAVIAVSNLPPIAASDTYTTDEDVALLVPAPGVLGNDSDGDGDALTAVLDVAPAAGVLTLETSGAAAGAFTYTPSLDFNGAVSFTYHAADGVATSDPVVATLTVAPVPDDPRPADVALATPEDTPLAIPIIPTYAYDPDGEVITITAIGTPAHGAATIADPASTVVYTPSSHYVGTDAFTYTVRDAGGASATAAVTVTVTEVNYPPEVPDLSVEAPMDTSVTIPVMDYASDPDDDPLTLTLGSAPRYGVATVVSPTGAHASIVYTPTPGFRRIDSFTYRVQDPGGLTAEGMIKVRMVPPPPTSTVAYVGTDAGLLILDVQDPGIPQYVGFYATPREAGKVSVAGNYAYVGAGADGLHVVDMTTPTHPVSVTVYRANIGHVKDLVVPDSGSPGYPYAYVADASGKLHVLDVSDPAHPQAVSSLALPGSPQSLALFEGADGRHYAYLPAGYEDLQIVDVSDPANPQRLAPALTDWRHGWASDVVVAGQRAYVVRALIFNGTATNFLTHLDISDPVHPVVEKDDYFSGDSRDMTLSGDPALDPDAYVYKASGERGLIVTKLSGNAQTATACDRAGNCTTVDVQPVARLQASKLSAAQSSFSSSFSSSSSISALDIFNVPAVLDTAEPLSVTVAAESTTSTTLQALTVHLDDVPIYTRTWASGAVTTAVESLTWTPGSDGLHVFRARATAWNGATATRAISVTVDTLPPQIGIGSEMRVLTSTHYYEPRNLDLNGVFTDAGGVTEVEWQAGRVGGPSLDAPQTALLDGHTWRGLWQLPLGDLPDGVTYVITATAQDIVGHLATVTGTVFVDVAGPSAVTPTLSSAGQPLAPGDLLRTVSPTLTLTWPAASDDSGVNGYRVRWSAVDSSGAPVSPTEQTVTPTQTRQVTYVAGEARRVSVQLASRDTYGNEHRQRWGSVVVDAPLTPDYVPLGDHGWMDSGCTLLGGDRRAAYAAPAGAAMGAGQKLYLTWNRQPTDTAGLRVAWTGASWGDPSASSGQAGSDLFVYLDVVDDLHPVISGTLTAFTPYTTSAAVTMPTNLAADYLLWVRDAESALLMHWTGESWTYRAALTAEQYQFDAALNDGQTDLLLPFETISVTQPASATLGLVAFAGRDGKIRAALPNANPIHAAGESGELIQLTHGYHWDGLGAGVCPNGSDGSATAYLDVEGVTTLAANPPGVASEEITPTANLGVGLTPVGDGQTIPYTFTYRNRGTVAATGLLLDLTAHGALRLVGGDLPDETHLALPLDDVAPGEKATLRFDSVVDTSLGGEQAIVAARVRSAADPSGPPLDQRWLAHPVDSDPPVFFGLQEPGYLIGPGQVRLGGYAYDESGVTEMWVELRPDGGLTKTLTCPDARPHDGRWACTWHADGFSDGTTVEVRLRAVDGFGQASGWSAWQPLRVDMVPPTVTLDVAATSVLSGSLVRESALTLVGDAADSGGVDDVQVCANDESFEDGGCESATLKPEDGLTAVTVEDVPTETIAIDASVACGSGDPSTGSGQWITRTFWVSERFTIGQVNLGFNASHDRRDDLVAVLESPAGTQVQVLGSDDTRTTTYRNVAVTLDDAHSAGLFDAQGDDTLTQVYGRQARPYEPLQAFQGQDAAGAWTLHVCDVIPAAHDGAYRRSRLALAPRHGAATRGRWTYQASAGDGPMDYVSRTFTIGAVDVIGNGGDPRTGTLLLDDDPQRLSVWVDNVAPVITMTGALADIDLGKTATILSGTVSDGSPTTDVFIHVQTPTGETYKRQAARDSARWWFDLPALRLGKYTLWVNATDLAGNATSVGPFEMSTLRFLYVPIALNNFSPEQQSRLYLPLVLRGHQVQME